MKQELDCEFKEQCKRFYAEPEMDEYRKNCDCINCALCDRYWRFYDRRYMKNRKGVRKDG